MCPTTTIDLTAPDVVADPYPTFDTERAAHPVAWHDGQVDIEVSTRDVWTLNPGFAFGRHGGAMSGEYPAHRGGLALGGRFARRRGRR